MGKTNEMKQIISYKPSTLETIDYAIYDWLNEEMNLSCTTNKGFKKTPLVWVSGERSWQVKNHKDLRDADGALIFPIITLDRTSLVKDPTKKGMFWGNIDPVQDAKGGSITIARKINQDKTANFTNASAYRKRSKIASNEGDVGGSQINFPNKKRDNPKIVYETITIPMPVYVTVTYVISIRTEYQQQMNELVQPFVTSTGGINYIILKRDGHSYETFIQQEFESNNNTTELGEETRIYETKININILGYLVGADKNYKQPKIVKRENQVEVRLPRERVILGDETPSGRGLTQPPGKYRS